jgi:phosphatidylglycerophosphate synthase
MPHDSVDKRIVQPMSAVPREIALRQVQEGLALYLHRPPARWFAKRLVATRITPIHVTLLGGTVGVAAGVLLAAGAQRPLLRVAGGIALMLSNMLDCADGELARQRGRYSLIGTLLDGVTDNVVGTAVFLGMAYDIVVYTQQPWLWLLGIAAGLSAAAHVWVFDAKKKQYLQCIGLAHPEEVQPISAVESQRRQALKDRRWFDAFLLGAFVFFRRTQSVGVSAAATSSPVQFWQANQRRMMNWTYMGSSIHFFALYVAAIVSPLWPPALLACALFYTVGLNALFLFLLAGKWDTSLDHRSPLH